MVRRNGSHARHFLEELYLDAARRGTYPTNKFVHEPRDIPDRRRFRCIMCCMKCPTEEDHPRYGYATTVECNICLTPLCRKGRFDQDDCWTLWHKLRIDEMPLHPFTDRVKSTPAPKTVTPLRSKASEKIKRKNKTQSQSSNKSRRSRSRSDSMNSSRTGSNKKVRSSS